MGTGRRVQFTQLLAQFGAVVDPVVQVVHGPLLRLGIGEIEHGQLRLAVTAHLERLHRLAFLAKELQKFFQCFFCHIALTLKRETLKQEVYQVDLGSLLGGGGVLFEDGADTDGGRFFPEGGGHDLLRLLAPIAVSHAIGICIGKEHDLAPPERLELIDIELVEPTGCQPHVLGVVLAEDDGCLLCLHDGDIPTPVPDQMKAEEAVDGSLIRLWLVFAPSQNRSHPCGILPLEAVAVATVVHHLAVAGHPIVVDLPEDHAALLRSSQPVTVGGIEHLLEGEVATAHHCLTERRVDRQAAVRHRGGMIEEKRLLPETFQDAGEAVTDFTEFRHCLLSFGGLIPFGVTPLPIIASPIKEPTEKVEIVKLINI